MQTRFSETSSPHRRVRPPKYSKHPIPPLTRKNHARPQQTAQPTARRRRHPRPRRHHHHRQRPPQPPARRRRYRYYQATQQQLRRAKSTNGFAIASLVCAIIGIGWYAPLILGPLAVLFGHIARGQIRREGQDGNGLAIAGLLMGYLQFVFLGCLPAFLEYDTRNQLTEAYGELGIPLAKLGDEIAAGKKNAGFTLPPSSRYWQEAYTGTAPFTPASKPTPPSPPP
ncbi:DUF4190 domain-containing protein [Kingella potus]|uniref:DUF4190 domain-containing protein n=1 Tax=Kingella potus TaxID=265175 RepID=UPI001FCFE06B|nr:DUF4190 domain-containing protein [Kingella potus]UOP01355.1 DUF4190 domain-containing protein [Kingella potus]